MGGKAFVMRKSICMFGLGLILIFAVGEMIACSSCHKSKSAQPEAATGNSSSGSVMLSAPPAADAVTLAPPPAVGIQSPEGQPMPSPVEAKPAPVEHPAGTPMEFPASAPQTISAAPAAARHGKAAMHVGSLNFKGGAISAVPAPMTDSGVIAAQPQAQVLSNPSPVPSDESYQHIAENEFLTAEMSPLSTFSIDVDTASYGNLRRFLAKGTLPPPDAIRIEEMINYFTYNYPAPKGDSPFTVHSEVAACPWQPQHRLVRIGIKGKEIARQERPASNLVFLLDVSGSMQDENKLPLVQRSMKLLVQKLEPKDHVAIVTYRETANLALPSIACSDENKARIIQTIESLSAGGSTQGSAGLELAYQEASAHLIKNGTNRVILTTDGDFNVGVTDQENLMRLIMDKAQSKVFLTVLGVGEGNLKDSTLETLADKGNGHYAYLDNLSEARKVLVEQMGATLITIAKDVKIQVEFNPAEVGSYRLIGYENRILADRDFNDDKKDAGEIGAGHTVTALYEVIPLGLQAAKPAVDPLKYQKPRKAARPPKANDPAYPEWKGELMTVKIRYKSPTGTMSQLLTFPVKDDPKALMHASEDFRFASAVAEFGMLLRDSEHKGVATYDKVVELAKTAKGSDEYGYRAEFITLVRNAAELKASN